MNRSMRWLALEISHSDLGLETQTKVLAKGETIQQDQCECHGGLITAIQLGRETREGAW